MEHIVATTNPSTMKTPKMVYHL